MWVYYLLLGAFFILVGAKLVEAVVRVIRRQHEAVRKEDWLELLLESLINGRL